MIPDLIQSAIYKLDINKYDRNIQIKLILSKHGQLYLQSNNLIEDGIQAIIIKKTNILDEKKKKKFFDFDL